MMVNHIQMKGISVMFVRMVWVYCVLAPGSSTWYRPPSIEFLLGDTWLLDSHFFHGHAWPSFFIIPSQSLTSTSQPLSLSDTVIRKKTGTTTQFQSKTKDSIMHSMPTLRSIRSLSYPCRLLVIKRLCIRWCGVHVCREKNKKWYIYAGH